MPEETDYQSWRKPPDGYEGWGDYYRNFLDDLDAKAFRYGPGTDRPSSAPEGALWYDTEDEVLYQYNGGGWERRGTDWGEYELVFDDEVPDSDQYIRLET